MRKVNFLIKIIKRKLKIPRRRSRLDHLNNILKKFYSKKIEEMYEKNAPLFQIKSKKKTLKE